MEHTTNLIRAALAAAVSAAMLAACGGGDDGPVVKSISNALADEGYSARHTVTLEAASQLTKYDFSASGTATAADYGAFSFSDGVTYDAGSKQISVPAGVASFTVSYPVTFDAEADAGETVIVKVGGASGTATLRDPADKHVGHWTTAGPTFGCEQVAAPPQQPAAIFKKTSFVITKVSHDEFQYNIHEQWFVEAGCKGGAVQTHTLPSSIYKVFSPKDVDGHRTDRVQNGGLKALANLRTEGDKVRVYGTNGPDKDADGFPTDLGNKWGMERAAVPDESF